MGAPPISAAFDVFRFDPDAMLKPRYQRYTLDLAPHTPVLTALLRIRSEIDPTLTLRLLVSERELSDRVRCSFNSEGRLACPDPDRAEIAAHGRS